MGRNHKIEIFMANNVSYRHCCPLFLVQNLGWNFSLEFRMLLCGRRKMGRPGKNPSEQGQEPPTNSTHKWHQVWELNLGHSGGRQTLSPLRYAYSLNSTLTLFAALLLSSWDQRVTLMIPDCLSLMTDVMVYKIHLLQRENTCRKWLEHLIQF